MIPIKIIAFTTIQGLTVAGIMFTMYASYRGILKVRDIIGSYNNPVTYWGKK